MFYFGRWGISSRDALKRACADGDDYTVRKALRDGAIPDAEMMELAAARGHSEITRMLARHLGLPVPSSHAMKDRDPAHYLSSAEPPAPVSRTEPRDFYDDPRAFPAEEIADDQKDSSAEEIEEDVGFVYLATNKGMKRGLVKIGMTKGDVRERMKELSNNTSVPSSFTCRYFCKVRSPREVEELLHKKYHFCRWRSGREFFKIDWQAVKAHLQTIEEHYGVAPKSEDLLP